MIMLIALASAPSGPAADPIVQATNASADMVDGGVEAARPVDRLDDPARAAKVERIRAERAEERDRQWFVTGYLLEQAKVHFINIPYDIVTGSLVLKRSFAAELGASYVAIPRFALPLPGFKLRGNSLELEGDVLPHFGHEKAAEIAGAVVLRSGSFGVVGAVSMNLAVGNGLSYAFTHPTNEKGREDVLGVDTPRLQYHISAEAEITSGATPHLHYVFHIHHRSGAYGLISHFPTGSNYLGFGLRLDVGHRSL